MYEVDLISRGTRLSEVELIENLAEHMKQARESSRALAHMRKDMRWIKVSEKLDYMRTQLMRLAVARSQ